MGERRADGGGTLTELTARAFTPRTRLEWALALWAFVVLTLSFVEGPATLTPSNIDSSWLHAVVHAAAVEMAFGDEVVFTYGPLGWVVFPHDVPSFRGALLAGNLVFGMGFAWLSLSTARHLPSAGRAFVFLGLCAYATHAARADLFVLAPIWVTLHVLRGPRARLRSYAAALAVMVPLACVKLTFVLAAVPCLLALCIYAGGRRGGLLLAIYGLGVAVLWSALGQPLSGLYAYLRFGAELVLGHAAAMGMPGDDRGAWLAAVTGVGVATLVGLSVRAAARRGAAVPTAIALVGTSVLVYKSAFVRADAHRISVFAGAAFLALVLPTSRAASLRVPVATLRVAIVSIASLAFVSVWPANRDPYTMTAGWGPRLGVVADWIGAPGRFTSALDREWNGRAEEHRLAAVQQEVGAAGVDYFPSIIGTLFANELNWQPRPVFDGRMAYREGLYDLNLAHVRGADAAPFALVGPWLAADGYLPSAVGAAGLRALLEGYRPRFTERDHLLMVRRDRPLELGAERAPVERTLRWGQSHAVNATDDELVWMSVEVQPSLLGRLRAAVLRPTKSFVVVTLDDGRVLRFRIAPGMVGRPVLLSPFLDGETPLSDLYRSTEDERHVSSVRSVRFEAETASMVGSEVVLRLRRAPVRGRLVAPVSASPAVSFDPAGPVPSIETRCSDVRGVHGEPLVAEVRGPVRLETRCALCPPDAPGRLAWRLDLGGRAVSVTANPSARVGAVPLHLALFPPGPLRVALEGRLGGDATGVYLMPFEARPVDPWSEELGARPIAVTAPFSPGRVRCGDQPGMALHAPGEAIFVVEPGSHRIFGHTGVCDDNESHGVTLLLGMEGPGGFRVAWGRTLSEEAARRATRLDIDVQVDVGAEEVLVLRALPDGDMDGDWTWFGGIRIE